MRVFIFLLIALCQLSYYVESITLECKFEESTSFGYTCEVEFITITSKIDRTITEVTGNHENNNKNDDVKYFKAQNQNVEFFPLELTKIFKNLESVEISESNLSEIHSSDLQQFGEKLKELTMGSNKIKIIEADLFKFNENLESIDLAFNQIYFIESQVFNGLDKLTKLYLDENSCIDGFVNVEIETKLNFLKNEIFKNCSISSISEFEENKNKNDALMNTRNNQTSTSTSATPINRNTETGKSVSLSKSPANSESSTSSLTTSTSTTFPSTTQVYTNTDEPISRSTTTESLTSNTAPIKLSNFIILISLLFCQRLF